MTFCVLGDPGCESLANNDSDDMTIHQCSQCIVFNFRYINVK